MAHRRGTILGIFAHPDDESMGPGATLAKYAAAGYRVAFVTATDGGAGRLYEKRPANNRKLKELRRRETEAAAEILGVEFLGFLGWEDGELEHMNILAIEAEFARIIRRERPDVVVTFHGSGISYHPDHRVVAMAIMGAFLGSGRDGWYRGKATPGMPPPHHPSKLYGYTVMRSLIERIDWPRDIYASPDDEITTIIDTSATAELKWQAILAHDTQRNGPPFREMYDGGGFQKEAFVRILPTWPAGAPHETDMFADLPPRG